ncbi:hypothetical protein [Sulfurihydrogenibium yellowstonense]|uniref:AT hook motif domain protein n=1 Tax=Sulfurihydrogenibium yellowstonense SS-5 TaxID=432331 RepID=C4FHU6_9AQUI|nr:hypothetical protein [Sulfurihydrogenibium yellowstonense]EEP61356.1 AT hook motif domain protein [Sulfurihydrogenibium yellowstonense SS-5]
MEHLKNSLVAVKILIAKILLNIQSKKKAGRPPKVSDLQLAALYITSYISNTPILTLARFLIYPSIQSWHLFRKSKSERVYKILREYWLIG